MAKAKKTLSLVMAVLMMAFTFLTMPAKAVKAAEVTSADPKIAWVGLEHSPLVAGETETFFISTENADKVQYQITMKSDKTGAVEDLTKGWTAEVAGNVQYTVTPEKQFELGKYTLTVSAKRVSDGKVATYPAYINVVNKDDANRVYTTGAADLAKTTYTVGETVTVNGVKDLAGIAGPYVYKMHVYNITTGEWLNDVQKEYKSNVTWTPASAGTYALLLYVNTEKSTTWAKYTNYLTLSNPTSLDRRGTYEGWKYAIVTVNPAPVDVKVDSVSATNLKEIVVKFNQEVDSDTAEDLANYKLKNYTWDTDGSGADDAAELQDDNKTVVITVKGNLDNQKEYTLTVDNVKSADEKYELAKVEKTFTAVDTEIPVAQSVEVTGPKSIKVNFSEPLKTAGTFKIDDGRYYASVSDFTAGDKSVEVSVGVEFTTGEHNVTIENNKDYYDFKNAKTTLAFTYAKDTTAPTVVVDDTTETKVTLKFSKIVKVTNANTDVTAYFDYNKNSTFKGVFAAKDADSNGYSDTYTATFSTPISSGSHVFYLNTKADKLQDKWGNDVPNTELSFSVSVDNTKPEVVSVVADEDNKLVVTFSEDVNSADAVRKAYYTLRDADGDKLTDDDYAFLDGNGHFNSNATLTYDSDDYTVTIKLSESLDGGKYALDIANVKDVSYKQNEMDDAEVAFEVEDTTGPQISSAVLNGDEDKIRVTFNESMSEEGLTDVDNYRLVVNGTEKALPDDSEVEIINSKTVEITLGDAVTGLDGTTDKIRVSSALKDASGNHMDGFYDELAISADSVGLKANSDDNYEAKFVDTDTIEVVVDKELDSIDASEITVAGNPVASAYFTNGDGKSTVTMLLSTDVKSDISDAGNIVFGAGALTSVFGTENAEITMQDGTASVVFTDAIAPSVATVDQTDEKTIVLTFSEAVDPTTVSKYTFEVEGSTIDTAVLGGGNTTLTLTLKDAIDTDALPTVTQKLDYEDATAGNVAKVADADIPDTADVASPVLKTAELADKTLTLTFSENIDEVKAGAVVADLGLADDANATNAGATGATIDTISVNDAGQIVITFTALGSIAADKYIAVLDGSHYEDADNNVAAEDTYVVIE